MPELRKNVSHPKRRKLDEAMRPGESRAATIVGVLLAVTIAGWALNFFLRLFFPGPSALTWTVIFALIAFVVFVGFLLRAIWIGTEDESRSRGND